MTEYKIGQAVVPLLRGIVYADQHPTAWEALIAIPGAAHDFVAALGLNIVIDESEGYAYLMPRPEDQDDGASETPVPPLVPRRRISYRVTLLLALLRGKLLELDAHGEQTRLVLTRDEIVDLLRTFHPHRDSEARMVREVEADLNKAIDHGFVRRVRDQPHTFEIRRIIKAFVTADWLAALEVQLGDTAKENAGG